MVSMATTWRRGGKPAKASFLFVFFFFLFLLPKKEISIKGNMSPPTSGSGKMADPRDLLLGAGLQCVEAATLGMPFEVWKTRMGR